MPQQDGAPEPYSTSEPGDSAEPGSTSQPGGTAERGSTPDCGRTAEPDSTAEPGTDTAPASGPAATAAAEPRDLLVAESPEGMFWTWELDMAGVLEAIGASQSGELEDQEQILAEEIAARESGNAEPRDLTGVIAEHLPAGPGLAAWLANAPAEGLSDWDLPGIAAAYHRVAAWAQAGELAAVAAIACRVAAADEKVGVDEHGEPARVTPGAASQVALALVMSQPAASSHADLAVQLQFRLAKTGMALTAGIIDLQRARLIADATGPLNDEAAEKVESRVLPKAGEQTTAELRAALRRAVIAADPEGADHRRRAAETRAKVTLHPDHDGTAALVGSSLPGIHAAAAMARITALANAMKAAGAGGGINLLRAQVFTGLLLGTLPFIPPPDGAPPDTPPGPDAPPDPGGPPDSDGEPGPDLPPGRDGEPGHGGSDTWPADPGPSTSGPHDVPHGVPSDGDDPDASGASKGGLHGGDREHGGPPGDGDTRRRTAGHAPPGAAGPGSPPPGQDATPPPNPPPPRPPGPARPPGQPGTEPWPDVPMPGDADAPPDTDPAESLRRPGGYGGGYGYDYEEDLFGTAGKAWPPLPGTITQIPPLLGSPPPGPGTPGPAGTSARDGGAAFGGLPDPPPPPAPGSTDTTRKPLGLLDLTISWRALNFDPAGPATLSRLGPITAGEAVHLAALAALDPRTQWRIILTDDTGRALAVERAWRKYGPYARTRPPGVIGRVTVTIPATALDHPPDDPAITQGIRTALLRAARRAATRAQEQQAADEAAGGCAHTMASPLYRWPARLREYINARDQTCRHPRCRQPAWHADLDHSVPWDKGGLTCTCNGGPHCRTHHKIKQEPGWTLTQPTPGHFELTTPAGRTYTSEPDLHPL